MSPAEFLIKTNGGVDNFGFLNSESILNLIVILKIVFIVFSVFLFLHIIYIIFKINNLQGRFQIYKDAFTRKTPPPYKGEFVIRWKGIKQRMQTMQEAEYKLAIIEADKIFDDLLKIMLRKGKDMGERLKLLNEELLPSINKVWESHKVRNKIAHDSNYDLSYADAQVIIENYEKALHELKILD